jgi:hypothetical protein
VYESAINYADPLVRLEFPLKPTDMSFRDKNHPLILDPYSDLPDF